MKIGNVIIDTNAMSLKEINLILEDLRKVRKRKEQMTDFYKEMETLFANARLEGFSFTDAHLGFVLEAKDIVINDDYQ